MIRKLLSFFRRSRQCQDVRDILKRDRIVLP